MKNVDYGRSHSTKMIFRISPPTFDRYNWSQPWTDGYWQLEQLFISDWWAFKLDKSRMLRNFCPCCSDVSISSNKKCNPHSLEKRYLNFHFQRANNISFSWKFAFASFNVIAQLLFLDESTVVSKLKAKTILGHPWDVHGLVKDGSP